MSHDQQPATAGAENEDEPSDTARLPRRRLLQALGGAAGLASVGLPENGPIEPARAQSDGSDDWTQQQKLAAADGDGDDVFGFAVSVSADGATAVVGAPVDEDPNGRSAGSAYVFTQSSGQWTQQQKLTPTDGDTDDNFGVAVSVSNDGTTALIGAYHDEDPNGDRAGSAYVFSQSNGQWTQQQKLAPTDGGAADEFGRPVSVSGDGTTALIGATEDDNLNGDNAGSAYVFSQINGQWTQQQKLIPDDGSVNDFFGFGVSMSNDGTTAVVGATGNEDPNGDNAGSAYVFSRSNDQWTQQQKLFADDGDEDDVFGFAVSVSADGATAVVGAQLDEDSNGRSAGSAYVFRRSGGQWTQQQKLFADDGDRRDEFGRAVSMSGDGTTVLIGTDEDEDPNGRRAGSAYVFTRSGGQWTQQQKLFADDGDRRDRFGTRVSVSGDGTTALIGATEDDNLNGDNAGSAYVFSRGDQQEPAPGDGSETPVELSLEAPETVQPGATLTVTAELTNQDVPEPTSGAVELTAVPEPLSVTGESENPVFLGFGNPLPAVGESVTQQFDVAVPEQAALEQELTLEAEATLQNSDTQRTNTTTQPVTIAEQQDPVERFDTNDEPGIQGEEVLDAISEFNEGGDVEATDVLDVISAFNENSG